MASTRLRVVLVAGLRYVPFFLYVVLLGVIHRSYVATLYQRTTNGEYCQRMGSIALLMLEVYHRVQTNEYAAELTYSRLFFYTTGDNLAGPIPAPHITRFVLRSDELLPSKYGRPATGTERPVLVPSTLYTPSISGFGSADTPVLAVLLLLILPVLAVFRPSVLFIPPSTRSIRPSAMSTLPALAARNVNCTRYAEYTRLTRCTRSICGTFRLSNETTRNYHNRFADYISRKKHATKSLEACRPKLFAYCIVREVQIKCHFIQTPTTRGLLPGNPTSFFALCCLF